MACVSCDQATLETVTVESAAPGGGASRRRARINTKLRSHGTIDGETVDTTKDTFFDRNFPGETEVLWFKFQQAFLSDYEAQLSGESSLSSECDISVSADRFRQYIFYTSPLVLRMYLSIALCYIFLDSMVLHFVDASLLHQIPVNFFI